MPRASNHLQVLNGVTACPSPDRPLATDHSNYGMGLNSGRLESKPDSAAAASQPNGNNYTYTCSNGALDSNDPGGSGSQHNMIYTSQAAAYPYQMLNEQIDDVEDRLGTQDMLDAPRGERNPTHPELPDRPSGVAHEITDLSKMYTVDSSDEEHDSSGDGRDYRSPGAPGDSQVEVHDTDLTTVLRPLGSSSRKAA